MLTSAKDWFVRCSPAARGRIAAGLIIFLALLSYGNTLRVPFIFDDIPTIQENPTILHLWPIGSALFPPVNSGLTTAGRPLVNLSLAFNYAVGGYDVLGYHIFNLSAHIVSALLLFGISRRLLARFHPEAAAFLLAVVIALLWVVHPLNTAAVTYIVQRAEVLMGLFYLLTIYAFLRSTDESSSRTWLAASCLGCYLSMGCKEVGATIPLVVLLVDRTFLAGTFAEAWKARWKFYLVLSSAWIFQALLVLSTGNRGGTAGLSTKFSTWNYLQTQAWAVANYLKLSLWPDPLIFDYGAESITGMARVAFPGTIILALLLLTAWALWKRPLAGFFGAVFFIVLAPTSSIIPVVTQTVAEHRMYLSLIPILSLLVVSVYRWMKKPAPLVYVGLTVALSITTHLRNKDYRTHLSIWRDTAEKRPENPRAWKCLGVLIAQMGNYPLAVKMYQRSKALEPRDPGLYFNTANALGRMGKVPEAIAEYETAIQMQPGFSSARNNLANILLQNGQPKRAVEEATRALKIDPLSVEAHYNLGRGFQLLGKFPEARSHLEESLRLRPGFAPSVEALAALNSPVRKQ